MCTANFARHVLRSEDLNLTEKMIGVVSRAS
jgi:hypothetical protein